MPLERSLFIPLFVSFFVLLFLFVVRNYAQVLFQENHQCEAEKKAKLPTKLQISKFRNFQISGVT